MGGAALTAAAAGSDGATAAAAEAATAAGIDGMILAEAAVGVGVAMAAANDVMAGAGCAEVAADGASGPSASTRVSTSARLQWLRRVWASSSSFSEVCGGEGERRGEGTISH